MGPEPTNRRRRDHLLEEFHAEQESIHSQGCCVEPNRDFSRTEMRRDMLQQRYGMEGLFLNRTATSCCETSHTAVPFASIDDIQLIIPTKLQSCMKLILCGSVRRNGKWEYCECSCNDTIINVQYA